MDRDKTVKNLKQLLLFSGLFNIIFASPLIFPELFEYYLFLFNYINAFLNLGGKPFTSPSNPIHSLLINTAGIDLVLVGAIILYASLDPTKRKGIILLNAIGRLLFAGIIIFYIAVHDVIRIVIFFGTIDVIISIGFLYFLKKV